MGGNYPFKLEHIIDISYGSVLMGAVPLFF